MSLARALAHYFVPRESNNHRAKLLHFSSLLVLVGSLLLFQFGMDRIPQSGQVLGYAAQISPQEVIRLTNIKRSEHGLAPLTYNASLSQAAQSKGAHMLSLGYWAHVAPDGTEPWKFFKDVNYKYRYAGENLARDFSNPSSAVDAWMASTSHRENLLSSKYKEIGIGVVEGNLNGKDTTIIVQLFGTAISDTPKVQVAADTTEFVPSQPKKTSAPIAIATPASTPVVTLGQSTPVSRVLISPFVTTRGISLAVISILIAALVVDFIVIYKKRIRRISGRTWAHLSFLVMLLIIVVILRAGQIV